MVVQRTLFLVLALSLTSIMALGSVGFSHAQTIETVDVVENKIVTLIGEGYDPDVEDLAYLLGTT